MSALNALIVGPVESGAVEARVGLPSSPHPVAVLIFIWRAHELGHAFGLAHDNRGAGSGQWIRTLDVADPMTTSFCAAEWLDAHRAFNTGVSPLNHNTTFEMLAPPSLVSPPNVIRLRFEVTDPDGLHQAQLHLGDALSACKRLNGTSSRR